MYQYNIGTYHVELSACIGQTRHAIRASSRRRGKQSKLTPGRAGALYCASVNRRRRARLVLKLAAVAYALHAIVIYIVVHACTHMVCM